MPGDREGSFEPVVIAFSRSKSRAGKDVYLMGGAQLASSLIDAGLDELHIMGSL